MNLEAYVHSLSSQREGHLCLLEASGADRPTVDRLAGLNLCTSWRRSSRRSTCTSIHLDTVLNAELGSVFEELILKFAEQSNDTTGEHFTLRESPFPVPRTSTRPVLLPSTSSTLNHLPLDNRTSRSL